MQKCAGLLLAGGLSRRMGGGDKGLRMLAGRPILDRIIERVRPQVTSLALNANGAPERFASYGLPVLPDSIGGFAGPLAGILTGMDWVKGSHAECRFVATFPTDAPFLPQDLVSRLCQAIQEQGADMACAASNGRHHPVVGLWPVDLAENLRRAMMEEDLRKVDLWTARHRLVVVEFETTSLPREASPGIDPFFNANRPEELEEAERYLVETAQG